MNLNHQQGNLDTYLSEVLDKKSNHCINSDS